MKIQGFPKTGFALATAMLVAFSTATIFAQDTATAPPVANSNPGPDLSGPVEQVLQLAQAKISDTTIITYVQNSGTVYGLDAPQIVYLKQQGVSEAVINAMLNQRNVMAAAAAAQTPPPQNYSQNPPPQNYSQTPVPSEQYQPNGDQSGEVAQPSTPAPSASSVYYVPNSSAYYCYNWTSPYYSYYYPYYSYYYPYYYSWGWPYYYYGYRYPYYRGYYYPGYHYGGYYGGGYYGGGYHSGGSWGGGGYHSGGMSGGSGRQLSSVSGGMGGGGMGGGGHH